MKPYLHRVQYYETDRMGVTHHSNYIRWMEEARVHFLDEIGWNYAKIEEIGISSPVISVKCDYKMTTTFDDVVEIDAFVIECKGAKFEVGYEMRCKGNVVFTGESSHCMLDKSGKLLRIKRDCPEFYEVMNKMKELHQNKSAKVRV